jgi:uncharacterized protein YneF (UPF0154 family)
MLSGTPGTIVPIVVVVVILVTAIIGYFIDRSA